MVRELLELDAGRRSGWIRIVAHEVAAADFHRVHADLHRREIDKPLRHRDRNRMANGAVLTHHIFILHHDRALAAIVLAGVRRGREVDDLIGLDAAGARINRIGSDAGEIVDFPRGNRAVLFHADLCFDAMVARMNVSDETFQPVGNELDRTVEHF